MAPATFMFWGGAGAMAVSVMPQLTPAASVGADLPALCRRRGLSAGKHAPTVLAARHGSEVANAARLSHDSNHLGESSRLSASLALTRSWAVPVFMTTSSPFRMLAFPMT